METGKAQQQLCPRQGFSQPRDSRTVFCDSCGRAELVCFLRNWDIKAARRKAKADGKKK